MYHKEVDPTPQKISEYVAQGYKYTTQKDEVTNQSIYTFTKADTESATNLDYAITKMTDFEDSIGTYIAYVGDSEIITALFYNLGNMFV